MTLDLSVCVACFNEASTLELALIEVLEALDLVEGDHEVLVIDDGSTDGSGQLAQEMASRDERVRTIHHEHNLGLGGFYRTSFSQARKDVLYFMAADLQPIPGEYFPQFLPLFESHDGVVGFDRREGDPILSRCLPLGEKLIFGFLFPGVPKIGGPLMLRRDIIEKTSLTFMHQQDRSWLVLWELMVRAKRAGCQLARVPVRRRAREKGTSRGSTLRTAVVMVRKLHLLRRALAESP